MFPTPFKNFGPRGKLIFNILYNILFFQLRYGDAMLKKDFAEDSLQHELNLEKPLNYNCPIRILHGLDDQVGNCRYCINLNWKQFNVGSEYP